MLISLYYLQIYNTAEELHSVTVKRDKTYYSDRVALAVSWKAGPEPVRPLERAQGSIHALLSVSLQPGPPPPLTSYCRNNDLSDTLMHRYSDIQVHILALVRFCHSVTSWNNHYPHQTVPSFFVLAPLSVLLLGKCFLEKMLKLVIFKLCKKIFESSLPAFFVTAVLWDCRAD